MQAGQLQVELTGGPAGGRHGEGLFDNGAPTAVTCGLRLNADRHAGRPDPGFLCVHEPGGPGMAGYMVGLDGRSVSRGSPGGGGIGTGCAAWTSPGTRSGGSAPG